jgi:phospholipase D1/2
MVVEDSNKIDVTMNGQRCQISPKVRELRVRLFKEHLGLIGRPESDPVVQLLNDPVCPEFYHDVLRYTASLNTQIYRELFHCIPDDCADSWEEYKRFAEKPSIQAADPAVVGIDMMENIKKIQGHIVMFPLNFLKKESLSAVTLSPEYLLPVETYM